MSKHTEGPWKFDRDALCIVSPSGISVICTRGAMSGDDVQADIALIAAAPDLLACLLAYVEQEEQAAPYSSSPMRERARAAIAKAEGVTP